ncbi:MAG TPA: hypothetical protein VOA41_00585 [Candidatus Dormibacteraeota bacterium]|nr:hypothetical protein [Candidatus Dormibacteraeota bacterium]
MHHTEAVSQAEMELARDDVAEQLFHLDRQTEVDKLLADLKAKRDLSN